MTWFIYRCGICGRSVSLLGADMTVRCGKCGKTMPSVGQLPDDFYEVSA